MTGYRHTVATVDLSAIGHNVRALQTYCRTPLMAVVKADAYGHGIVPVSRAALEAGAFALAVAIPEEGETLRAAGIRAPILVLGNVNQEGAEASARYSLIQTVSDAHGVLQLQVACERLNTTAVAHVKLDTGMNRIGARGESEVRSVLEAFDCAPRVTLAGVFTHIADADGDDGFTRVQLSRFDGLLSLFPKHVMTHCAASVAMLRYRESCYDAVRAGIALYGCPPIETSVDLRPVMRLTTEVIYLKEIAPGDCVSYGRTFCAKRPTRIATLPIGYGDGYLRACSGRAQALVGGRRCPVVGRVCMDQMMLDVTDAGSVSVGDEVVLLGSQGQDIIGADELAGWAGTISYEVLLSPSSRVPRRYVNG